MFLGATLAIIDTIIAAFTVVLVVNTSSITAIVTISAFDSFVKLLDSHSFIIVPLNCDIVVAVFKAVFLLRPFFDLNFCNL